MVAMQTATLAVRAVKLGPEAYGLIALVVLLTLVAGVAALVLPESIVLRLEAAAALVAKTPLRAASVLALVTLGVLLANALLQQPNAWDERGVLDAAPRIANAGLDGLIESYRVNAWLGPQHPPLPPLVYGAVWALGGTDALAMRMVGIAFGTAALLVVLRIGERLYDLEIGLRMSGLLLTSPLLVRTASAATNDVPLLFFFCLAILCGIRLLESPTDRRAAVLGAVIGLGLLTKYTMVFVYPVLVALVLRTGRPPRAWRLAAIVLAVSLAMLGVWLVFAYELGILAQQTAQVGRLATITSRTQRFAAQGVLIRLPSAIGVYAVPLVLLGLARCLRFVKAADAVVLAWLLGVSVPVALTMPVNRMFMPAFPAVTAVMALALADRPRIATRLVLLLAALCATTLLYYGWVDLSVRLSLY